MQYTELPLPVPIHETLDVLDSTKLQTFMDCPRKFFYQYILGWRSDSPNIHLAFGSAWHEAMEVLMSSLKPDVGLGYTPQVVALAQAQFEDTFNDKYPDILRGSSDQGKTLGNALAAIAEYAHQYRHDNFVTHYVEVAGTAPISDDRVIHFKLDSIIEQDGRYWCLEHKTTGRLTGSWMEKWGIILQVGTYAHALFALYEDDAAGAIINGAVLRRESKRTGTANNEYIRVPVRKSRDMMLSYLHNVNHWVAQLDWNMRALAEQTADDPVMSAFPSNGTSCTKFSCPFAGLCSAVANPLRLADQPPPGFHVEHWDPRRMVEEAEWKLDLATMSKPEKVKGDG